MYVCTLIYVYVIIHRINKKQGLERAREREREREKNKKNMSDVQHARVRIVIHAKNMCIHVHLQVYLCVQACVQHGVVVCLIR